MSRESAQLAVGTATLERAVGTPRRYLFGPTVDFLCLGGLSLALYPFLFLLPEAGVAPTLSVTMLVVANFINHPHFAFSYQIFYRGFWRKAFRQGELVLRGRYIVAGIVAPILLAAFLLIGLTRDNATLLGLGGNVMALLVGWHYVKQGYGMLMVDAALKRLYFQRGEKRILLINSLTVWLTSWVLVNVTLKTSGLWGIQYYMFDFPPTLVIIGLGLSGGTSILTLLVLARRFQANGQSLPWNGVVAYVASLYLWLLFVRTNPLWLFVTPALHSLQYLVVVARFEINRERKHDQTLPQVGWRPLLALLKERCKAQLFQFALLGFILGALGFWGMPHLFDFTLSFDRTIFGATPFLFVFWIFINVHHYFLDNVMWRR
jgi:hypothetical protein